MPIADGISADRTGNFYRASSFAIRQSITVIRS
jgi:hypothetical protein